MCSILREGAPQSDICCLLSAALEQGKLEKQTCARQRDATWDDSPTNPGLKLVQLVPVSTTCTPISLGAGVEVAGGISWQCGSSLNLTRS